MSKKQVIRLNESQLRQIIKESVNKILKEGKKVNNKPYFDKYYSNETPKGEKVKPGQTIYNGLKTDGTYSPSDWDLKGNHRQKNGGLSRRGLKDLIDKISVSGGIESPYFQELIDDSEKELKLQKAMQKHNQRVKNYMYSGNHGENSDRLHTLWGSKEQEDETHQNQMKNRKEWAEMLKVNGISLKEYSEMGEDEQDECWEYYREWNSPRNRRARYWDEIGDPNWDNIYDNL